MTKKQKISSKTICIQFNGTLATKFWAIYTQLCQFWMLAQQWMNGMALMPVASRNFWLFQARSNYLVNYLSNLVLKSQPLLFELNSWWDVGSVVFLSLILKLHAYLPLIIPHFLGHIFSNCHWYYCPTNQFLAI